MERQPGTLPRSGRGDVTDELMHSHNNYDTVSPLLARTFKLSTFPFLFCVLCLS